LSHLWAVILGLVQGATEFLPISSTAHLKMIPWLFGIQTEFPVLASAQFDIALHAGSFIAILLALWPDWVELVRGAFAGDRDKLRFLGFLAVTTVPAALVGALFESRVEFLSTPSMFHYAPLVIGVAIVFFGILLWAVDRLVPRSEPLDKLTWLQAALVGLGQALALVPGVSRSGATITTGRALGLSREAIAKYSFMAALPIIGGAAVFGLRHVPVGQLLSVDWVLGFTAAAVSSVVAMRFMLAYVKEHSYGVFAVYRVVVGLLVIAVFFFRG
jgi:undecaprenyl-diphosphatase